MKTSEILVTYIDHMGSDLSVVNAARVSFEKESEWEYPVVQVRDYYDEVKALSDKDAKLIRYLAKHEHKSPFNHCFASFRVKAPVFVARQLVKHKFLPWNEVSRRYVDSEPEFFIPASWRKRSENVKQGSSDKAVDRVSFPWVDYGSTGTFENYLEICLGGYNSLLEQGVCPEQARMVLPQNTMTEWIWSGSLGAFADMCRLRLDSHTQKETQCVAQQVAAHLKEFFPVSFAALMEN